MLFAVLSIFLACDDGDLQVETLDFDSETIQFCDTSPVVADVANLLFKINDSEALILELPAGTIRSAVTTEPILSQVSESGPSRISFRLFSDDVSEDYFCSTVPLTEPTVLEEIIAQGGEVRITTVIGNDSLSFNHTIEFSGISLVTSSDERITDLSINNFGTVQTPVPIPVEDQ